MSKPLTCGNRYPLEEIDLPENIPVDCRKLGTSRSTTVYIPAAQIQKVIPILAGKEYKLTQLEQILPFSSSDIKRLLNQWIEEGYITVIRKGNVYRFRFAKTLPVENITSNQLTFEKKVYVTEDRVRQFIPLVQGSTLSFPDILILGSQIGLREVDIRRILGQWYQEGAVKIVRKGVMTQYVFSSNLPAEPIYNSSLVVTRPSYFSVTMCKAYCNYLFRVSYVSDVSFDHGSPEEDIVSAEATIFCENDVEADKRVMKFAGVASRVLTDVFNSLPRNIRYIFHIGYDEIPGYPVPRQASRDAFAPYVSAGYWGASRSNEIVCPELFPSDKMSVKPYHIYGMKVTFLGQEQCIPVDEDLH